MHSRASAFYLRKAEHFYCVQHLSRIYRYTSAKSIRLNAEWKCIKGFLRDNQIVKQEQDSNQVNQVKISFHIQSALQRKERLGQDSFFLLNPGYLRPHPPILIYILMQGRD